MIKLLNILNPVGHALRWIKWRRVCSWCHGHIGGNPFSHNVTHGVCRKCKDGLMKGFGR
jgi:hypothetical protein